MGRSRAGRKGRGLRSTCRVWKGRVYRGYGILPDGQTAHVVAYDKAHGPPPKGWQRHHLCGNKLCVNPAHMIPLLPAEHLKLHARPALRLARAARA